EELDRANRALCGDTPFAQQWQERLPCRGVGARQEGEHRLAHERVAHQIGDVDEEAPACVGHKHLRRAMERQAAREGMSQRIESERRERLYNALYGIEAEVDALVIGPVGQVGERIE